VLNRGADPRVPEDLSHIPLRYAKRPIESLPPPRWIRPVDGLLEISSRFAHGLLYALNVATLKHIENQVVKYGREMGADTLWCMLQGQSTIRLGRAVAKRLKVPLYVQVFDPPTWELRFSHASRISSALLLREFGKAVGGSRGCATISLSMAEQYARDYGARTVALFPSVDGRAAVAPSDGVNRDGELVVALAGQVYAAKEWEALLSALDSVDWRIAGRDVRIRLLGRWSPPFGVNKPMRIEYLGWQTQENTVRILSSSDVLYCPYPFDHDLEDVARLSFPSKLTTYLQTGRAVLFHGPAYAGPAAFLERNKAGLICDSLDEIKIIQALTTLATDRSLYAEMTRNGRAAFERFLTLDRLRAGLAEFFGVEEDSMNPADESQVEA
jgi:glycosyltransferase involved in cell wall biosynthesis